MATELARPEELDGVVTPVVARAGAIVVATPEQYTGAADFLKAVKAAQKKVQEHFGPMKAAAHASWKKITATESETLAPLADAEKAVKAKMLTYYTEQEKIRLAEERKLQAAADEKARREREALEKKAASMKTEAKQEEYREAAAAVAAPVVQVASVRPVIQGQSVRKTWKAKITDQKAAVMAVMAWPDWAGYIKLQEAEFNRFAARTKGAVAIPGVEFYEESTLASTSR